MWEWCALVPQNRAQFFVEYTNLRRNAALKLPMNIISTKLPRVTHYTTPTPNFLILGDFPSFTQNLNGISVSRPPKIGERPYPMQFHPVEFTPIFRYFRHKSITKPIVLPRDTFSHPPVYPSNIPINAPQSNIIHAYTTLTAAQIRTPNHIST